MFIPSRVVRRVAPVLMLLASAHGAAAPVGLDSTFGVPRDHGTALASLPHDDPACLTIAIDGRRAAINRLTRF